MNDLEPSLGQASVYRERRTLIPCASNSRGEDRLGERCPKHDHVKRGRRHPNWFTPALNNR